MPRAKAMLPADRRAAIVEAVLPFVVERGELPSTREIAVAAGIAEGTLYRAFDDKTALLHAVAEHALAAPEPGAPPAPPTGDLHAQVAETVRRVQTRMRTVSTVLMAVRRQLLADGGAHRQTGPPAYLVEADRQLLALLTCLFEAHRAELRVEPSAAALALRSLVLGAEHPGMPGPAGLGPEQIADVVVHGVQAPAGQAPGGQGAGRC